MNIRALILAGVASVTLATAAQAAECNLSENAKMVMTPKALGAVSAAQPAEIVEVLYKVADVKGSFYAPVRAACTQEQILAAFVRINGSAPVGLEQPFKIPVLIAGAPAPAPTAVASASPTMVSKPVVQPIPVAASPELAVARARLADTDRQLGSARAALTQRPKATWTPAEVARVTALEKSKSNLEQRISDIETTLAMKANTADVNAKNATQDTAIAAAATAATTAQTTAEEAKTAAATAGGVSAWFWWLAVLGIPAALLLGLYSLVFKAGKSRVKKVEEDVEIIQTAVSNIQDTLPADIKLDVFWYDEVLRLQTGAQAVLTVLVADGEGYEPKFTIRVEKISDEKVGILSGIQGHPGSAEVMIGNLSKTVRKAGFKNRLNEPFGLRAAA